MIIHAYGLISTTFQQEIHIKILVEMYQPTGDHNGASNNGDRTASIESSWSPKKLLKQIKKRHELDKIPGL